jgi:hypothetical protein
MGADGHVSADRSGSQRAGEEPQHHPTIELLDELPREVEAGAPVPVRVRVGCARGCDLRGARVEVIDSGGDTISEHALTTPAPPEGSNELDLIVTAPAELGEAVWDLVLPEQELAGAIHDECRRTVTVAVVAHATSLAVWDVPSPVTGSRFTIRLGVRCSSECPLGGRHVEVLDESGLEVGEGHTSEKPRPGTTALYEAEVSLVAPDRPGVFSHSVRFTPAGSELPHLPAQGTFTFRVVEAPEHSVTVRIVPGTVSRSLDGIEVRLGPYRATTDDRGLAIVGVPKGTFELSVWRIDIEPVSLELQVTGDRRVEVEVEPRRVVDEDAERTWM